MHTSSSFCIQDISKPRQNQRSVTRAPMVPSITMLLVLHRKRSHVVRHVVVGSKLLEGTGRSSTALHALKGNISHLPSPLSVMIVLLVKKVYFRAAGILVTAAHVLLGDMPRRVDSRRVFFVRRVTQRRMSQMCINLSLSQARHRLHSNGAC